MADIIVVLIVIVLLGFALRGAIRHFKGDSPCCGGGPGLIKTDDKELKNPVIGQKIVRPATGQGLAYRPERLLFVDALHQRGREDVAGRPVGR